MCDSACVNRRAIFAVSACVCCSLFPQRKERRDGRGPVWSNMHTSSQMRLQSCLRTTNSTVILSATDHSSDLMQETFRGRDHQKITWVCFFFCWTQKKIVRRMLEIIDLLFFSISSFVFSRKKKPQRLSKQWVNGHFWGELPYQGSFWRYTWCWLYYGRYWMYSEEF